LSAANWTAAVDISVVSSNLCTITTRDTVPVSGKKQRFLQLKVTQ
jgi:hypothetical protein